ncbi:hypothetical protein AAFF39_08215 [Lactococcus garvieae]
MVSKFLQEEEDFKEAFVIFDEEFDASNTVRPRTSPLFHNYKGKKVWTTFSEDQVDVNIKDPKMFARLTEVLLTYASKGAASIRLDAIGFYGRNLAVVRYIFGKHMKLLKYGENC